MATVMCSLFGGHHLPMLAQVVFICELSIIFFNIREIMGKDGKGIFPMINNLLFFATTTLTRVFMFFMLFVNHFKASKYYNFDKESSFHKAMFWIVFFIFLAIYGLNLFWYKILLNTTYKIIFSDKKDIKK